VGGYEEVTHCGCYRGKNIEDIKVHATWGNSIPILNDISKVKISWRVKKSWEKSLRRTKLELL